MDRTYIKDLGQKTGEMVRIDGWVAVRRDQGKMIFFDFRDMTGEVQGVVLPGSGAMDAGKETRNGFVVTVTGIINKRPERNVQADKQNGDIEMQIESIEILSAPQELPFDPDADVHIETLLDYRPFTLRTARNRDIFKVQATIVDEYRNALKRRMFTEFQAPALVGGDAEGGSAVFKLEYFNESQAYLATSPQLYKEIMVGAFERAFTIAKIFRAEKSATTRHVAELTQMDFEMGFIKDHTDVMATLTGVIRDVVARVGQEHADVFARFGTEVPQAPDSFPTFTLREAQEIIKREFGRDVVGEPDMEPEDERQICEYAKKEFGSDFVFITHFPTKKRAFYTYADPENPELSLSFDLLFRGLEINSGSQRIHNYDEMVAKIESRGMDPKKFQFYLQAFKYGMPPHGGCSTGLERITARMLELANVKEASAFPRDMTRIDIRLSTEGEE
ncbi:aspartate--tRNA(Asn) ligase [Candidatus Kaiserbacteria bacterium]|nr:aspartate--tRNA(Asn) ligase [Candidatus Kaiserbacteria bacterium]